MLDSLPDYYGPIGIGETVYLVTRQNAWYWEGKQVVKTGYVESLPDEHEQMDNIQLMVWVVLDEIARITKEKEWPFRRYALYTRNEIEQAMQEDPDLADRPLDEVVNNSYSNHLLVQTLACVSLRRAIPVVKDSPNRPSIN